MKLSYFGLAAVTLWSITAPVFAQDDVDTLPSTRHALHVMENTTTVGHPDLRYEYRGMEDYAIGNYKNAMCDFQASAWYADKVSQLSIGLMYLNGQGVQKDPVKAYAWVALSAEREYPQFEKTRDGIWQQLNPDQQKQALALEQTLYKQFGDVSAKPREVRAIHDGWMDMFGAGVAPGFIGYSDMYISQGNATCESDDTRVCTDFYSKWFWVPKEYFGVRDAMWKGTVTIGNLQGVLSETPTVVRSKGIGSQD